MKVFSIRYDVLSMKSKIVYFWDLESWKEAHQLVLEVYRITKIFPKDELFGLVSQMRRADVSISSNIAEGFSRRTAKDKVLFYTRSLCSLAELQNQLILSKDLAYLDRKNFKHVFKQAIKVQKLINGLNKSASTKK